MASSTKPRAQGAGRKANTEPRMQVFKEFTGCNFELSQWDFVIDQDINHQEQADLQMNYVVIQNNAGITSNKTIETRNNITTIAEASGAMPFTGTSILIGNKLFLSVDNGNDDYSLVYIDLEHPSTAVNVPCGEFVNGQWQDISGHHWQGFEYVDDSLVATTSENKIWTGSLNSSPIRMNPPHPLPDPTALVFGNLQARGDLAISASIDNDHPYRIAIAYSYVNNFGPTTHSAQFTFYANYPVDEWHNKRYLVVTPPAPAAADLPFTKAAEFYYTAGNSAELLFAGRKDADNSGSFAFEWYGYLDATYMWPLANLLAPEENYTNGAKASKVTCIDSRVYFWGDVDKPYRLYIGGNPGNLLSVSPGTCGGYVDVEPGTDQEIRVVEKYKTQSGASIVTMLCDSPNTSAEQRYNLVENSVSLSNEQTMKSWQAEQVAGAVGCKSFNGAVVCEDGLYSVSRYGLALTTMTMEYNSQIRTNYVSDPVKPAFTDSTRTHLKNASVIECDGVIYLAFGNKDETVDNLLFCYDIDNKAWWTVSLDVDEPILNLLHIDYEGCREGIGIITAAHVYLLPLTQNDSPDDSADFPVTIQTGELSTTQPQQNWFYLSQLEFRFDFFKGNILVELDGIDQFGREIKTCKVFSHDTAVYDLAEYMRVDLRLQSYRIRITGTARFRLTHFIAKLYVMSAKQGLVWGFDDHQRYRTFGDIHPAFKNYNDIRLAIIP